MSDVARNVARARALVHCFCYELNELGLARGDTISRAPHTFPDTQTQQADDATCKVRRVDDRLSIITGPENHGTDTGYQTNQSTHVAAVVAAINHSRPDDQCGSVDCQG